MPQARLPDDMRHRLHEGEKVEAIAEVRRPVEEVFAFWRHFDNLPRFMTHLTSVSCIDERLSHWVWSTKSGLSFEWHAEIIAEAENRMISWQTLPGSAVSQAGSVWFRPGLDSAIPATTEVRVFLLYHLPFGRLSQRVAEILGEDPKHVLEQDLKRLKALLEISALSN